MITAGVERLGTSGSGSAGWGLARQAGLAGAWIGSVRCGGARQARRVMASCVGARIGGRGVSGQVSVRRGEFRFGRSCLVVARQAGLGGPGTARHGSAGTACPGKEGLGAAVRGEAGTARHVLERRGPEWQARQCAAQRGMARHRKAGRGSAGGDGHGDTRRVALRQGLGSQVLARRVAVRSGSAWPGKAGLGMAVADRLGGAVHRKSGLGRQGADSLGPNWLVWSWHGTTRSKKTSVRC